MITTSRRFLTELYEEHLESASFLYEQRHALLHDPEMSWKKIGHFEQRLEAHIDALVIGNHLALDVCEKRVAECDPGELYAIACVFCRQNRQNSVLAIFDGVERDDAGRNAALADALQHELPEGWITDFATLLGSADPKLAPILARAFGYRRLAGVALLNAAKRCAAAALPEIVWALGRSSYQPAKDCLFDYLRSEEPPTRQAAAIALARMGDSLVAEYCIDYAHADSWWTQPLGLAGGRAALGVLTRSGKEASAHSLTAIGLLGDPAYVPFLLHRLEDVALAATAAAALQCLTGAGLYETVFVADTFDEDELFESERERLSRGEQLDRGDGRPFGSNITRVCQDPQTWKQWWFANASHFSSGLRYRNGHPFSPVVLVDMLRADNTPYLLRESCLNELAIRYGYDARFEADSPVVHQLDGLTEAGVWSHSNAQQYQEGIYYFAGSPQR